jgi:regulatory protein
MMDDRLVVTKISRKGRSRKFLVYVNEKLFTEMAEETLLQFGLRTGGEMEKDRLEEMRDHDLNVQAKEIALNYISYRPRTRMEIADRLRRSRFPATVIDETVRACERNNLINDSEFAQSLTRDTMRKKAVGKNVLRQKLLQKGIHLKLANEVLEQLCSEETEREAARRALLKKMKSSKLASNQLSDRKIKSKLYGFLMRQGFSADVIHNILRIEQS